MRPHATAPPLITLHLFWMAALLSTLTLLLLTGCGAGRLLPPSTQAGAALHGHVHGGQQPVAGARVYLLAANTTGYAGAGIAPSGANSSLSLLNFDNAGNADDIGAYVTTLADGTFDISGDYSCTPNAQVYLYASGGNPGGGTNSAAGFLALLGACPALGNFSSVPFIEINELSTVAAAYSIAGYASDPLHVATNGSPQAIIGLANAFATAANLVDLGSGTALATTPTGNGTAPQATVNTLGNILASCVNTADNPPPVSNSVRPMISPLQYSAQCVALAEAVTGGDLNLLSGYAYDTATDAIFIAQNPAASTAALYTLPPPQFPFSPALTSRPNDFTVSIAYTGDGLTSALRPAVDAEGNVWVADISGTGGNGAVAKFSPLGVPLSSAWVQSNFNEPVSVAIDASGNAWLNNTVPGSSLTEYSSSGSEINTSTATGISYFVPASPVLDLSGNLWVVNANFTADLVKFSSTGAFTQTFTGNGIGGPHALAVDTSNNIWVANAFTISKFTNAGGSASGSPFSLSDTSNPAVLAFDASGNLWALKNDLSVDVLNSSGTEIAGSPYNTSANAPAGTQVLGQVLDGAGNDWIASVNSNYFTYPFLPVSTFTELAHNGNGSIASVTPDSSSQIGGIALDSAGNLWITAGSQLLEYVGLSTPIETPLVQAAADSCLAQRPCLPPT